MGLLERTIEAVGELDSRAMAAARARQDSLTKPPGSLGVLEELAVRVAGITGQAMPAVADKAIITMAADHGVVAEGVSAWPAEVTLQMVGNFVAGGAAINVLARHAGARVVVVDMGVATPVQWEGVRNCRVRAGTGNIAVGPAMSRQEAVACLEAGIAVANEQIDGGVGLLGTGDMGIGNTTPSSAILAALSGFSAERIVGRGTGIDDTSWQRKVLAVQKALAVNRPDPWDGIDVLAKVGGLEIGGLAGCILGAAARRVPVIIDGFISGAAALIAARIQPRVRDFMLASHLSVEPGHRVMLDLMGLEPILKMNLRLGEGTGAALAMTLVDAALKIQREMATFESAGVSQKS
ncbi:MAG: nicotinate-nucleotide--dimethylbenzimidazole phosphoribosyltransferase [Syntrophomonadaceae bacterium]|jgi:nicotinate-nucleotide--dimethylbenzimidazole phosphoribosyltransferase|nr:nicotinate-nucleotide--dimethylbenzimidazole phosphoribosyltransferase [Syntrophomonadaceae bacterium]MDH7498235.1 nicotinate-nucleotide--dimethylbenzimidazole phosphoribosyltransferase [Syntrophomonadaceae bacterium]